MAVPLLISYNLKELTDSRNLEPGSLMPLTVDGSVYACPHCNQAVNRDALGEVLHHEVPNHSPLQELSRHR
jgi:hypothetical protein